MHQLLLCDLNWKMNSSYKVCNAFIWVFSWKESVWHFAPQLLLPLCGLNWQIYSSCIVWPAARSLHGYLLKRSLNKTYQMFFWERMCLTSKIKINTFEYCMSVGMEPTQPRKYWLRARKLIVSRFTCLQLLSYICCCPIIYV